ncbi:IBR domain-containing protein [Metarhizium brunneum]
MEADRKVETERPYCSVCAVAEYNFYSEVFGIPCPQCGECLTLAFYKSHLIVCHQDEFFVAHICSECENKIWECTQYASFGSEAWGQNENYADYTESTLKHRDTVESVLTECNAYEAIADPSQSQRKPQGQSSTQQSPMTSFCGFVRKANRGQLSTVTSLVAN